MGLDYHYLNSTPEIQQYCFKRQLLLGVRLKKPIVIHTREAEVDTKQILIECLPLDWPVHFHCFTGIPLYVCISPPNYYPQTYKLP